MEPCPEKILLGQVWDTPFLSLLGEVIFDTIIP